MQSTASLPVTQGLLTAGNSTLLQMPSNSSGNDFQNQMMMMLTESFSKLSLALCDKKEDTKSEWPKFSGDSKKIRP